MTPRAKRTTGTLVRECAAAGALGAGVFTSLLGLLGALARVGVVSPQNPAIGAAAAGLLTVLPLAIAVKAGYRDDTPPLLRAYRRRMPGARTPSQELGGALLGGAAWVALSADLVAMLALSTALVAGAVGHIHGRKYRPRVGLALVIASALGASLPVLLLSPRALAALGGGRALGVLGREYNDRAQRLGEPLDRQRAAALWGRACRGGDPDSCFRLAAGYEPGGALGADAAAADHYARLGCDAPGRDLWYCERFIGAGFASGAASAAAPPASAAAPPTPPAGAAALNCSGEARCPGAGHDCEPSLATCKESMAPRGYAPVCARLLPSGIGWRETWCPGHYPPPQAGSPGQAPAPAGKPQ
jgi:hypothetical protein